MPISVVLPAPLGPSSAKKSPCSTSRSTPAQGLDAVLVGLGEGTESNRAEHEARTHAQVSICGVPPLPRAAQQLQSAQLRLAQLQRLAAAGGADQLAPDIAAVPPSAARSSRARARPAPPGPPAARCGDAFRRQRAHAEQHPRGHAIAARQMPGQAAACGAPAPRRRGHGSSWRVPAHPCTWARRQPLPALRLRETGIQQQVGTGGQPPLRLRIQPQPVIAQQRHQPREPCGRRR